MGLEDMTGLMCFLLVTNPIIPMPGGTSISIEQKLLPAFRHRGILAIADDDTQLILPVPQVLVLVDNGRASKIKSMRDLQGFVTLGSTDEALAFARLRTQVEFGELLGDNAIYEIATPSQIDSAFVAGLTQQIPYYRSLGDWGFARAGIVSEDWLRRAKLPPLSVAPTASGWRISRTVVYETERDEFEIRRLTEDVGRDGAYSASSIRLKNVRPPGYGWGHYPYRE